MKYIDADKLIAQIQWMRGVNKVSLMAEHITADVFHGRTQAINNLIEYITSHQQEQPSLPPNLDEAAEEYAYNNWEDNDYHTGASEGLPFDAIGHTEKCFKAGAKWMAGQGKTKEAVIGMATEEISINVSQQTLDELDLCPGDKVVVQIRKEDIAI